jgi:hypothetical protein
MTNVNACAKKKCGVLHKSMNEHCLMLLSYILHFTPWSTAAWGGPLNMGETQTIVGVLHISLRH